jgi:hypothetical protein
MGEAEAPAPERLRCARSSAGPQRDSRGFVQPTTCPAIVVVPKRVLLGGGALERNETNETTQPSSSAVLQSGIF